MLSSSGQLFLLFLLLIPFPVVGLILLLKQAARGRTSRTAHRITRVPNVLLYPCLGALFRGPTAHERLQQTFAMMESSILRKDEKDRWRALISESEATIESFLNFLNPQNDIDFADFIRCVTLRVFLVVFQSVDPESLPFAETQQVTEALYNFYNDAEGRSALHPEIQDILSRWLPHDRFPDPLKRILPAYEALWQIAAAIVVRCEDDETGDLCWMMLDFRDNPRNRQYKVIYGTNGRSVSAITDEVVGCLTPITRMRYDGTAWWPWSFLHHSSSRSTAESAPAAQEALKFAALVASKVIGRLGPQYELSTGRGSDPQVHCWDGRRIGVRSSGVQGSVPQANMNTSQ